MLRTHVVLALVVGLALLESVTHRVSFLPLLILATLLPDLDTANSYLGKHSVFRPFQWFTRHRGLLHSLTFCFVASAVFAFFVPVVALPFFLGYGLHLFADSMTVEGIRPLWPAKWETRGLLHTGSAAEAGIFYVLCGICIVLAILITV
jgi:membrane-bound metal-dependent hydrolase YbcI (DUF457 family)